MSDIARRLGETLLGRDKLLPSEVQAAIVAAREEAKTAAALKEMDTLAGQLRFAVRLRDAERRVGEVKRIVTRIMEIVE